MIRRLLPFLMVAILAGCAQRPDPQQRIAAAQAAPEGGSAAQRAVPSAVAKRHMVAAANPLAVEAGREILRAGGSAVDAAIATQLVLNLVEPQSSGIGGGAFLLHYAAESGEIAAYDGRETAPLAATPALFLTAAGEPMDFWSAVIGGRSVGTPGLLRMLALAHHEHGRLPWTRLFAPAIALAEAGFAISPRLHGLLADEQYLRNDPDAAALYYESDGTPKAAGTGLRNPAFAATLRAIAESGAEAFYQGAIARDIVAEVRGATGNPGLLALDDLAGYQAKRRDAICLPYRVWRICGMPPPTSGGVAVLQIMALLERFDLAALPPPSPTTVTVEAVHLIAEASRLAFADRDRYLADADFVDMPLQALLDPSYLRARSALIRRDASLGTAEPGLGERREGAMPAQPDPPATSHLVVVDETGNVVSMTSSIESAFGSRLMVRGFLLNNELTDFSFAPEADGRPVANRVEPGKRPRSSMAPIIVLDQAGRPVLAVGSPGGSSIIGYVVKALVALLDWQMEPQAAVALPNFLNRNGPTDLEFGSALTALAPALEARGQSLRFGELTSGLHVVAIGPAGLSGGADPRREGVALGD